MTRLSPKLKNILFNTPVGAVRPAPAHIGSLYSDVASEAAAKGLEKPVWVSMLTALTVGFNSPDSMIHLLKACSRTAVAVAPPTETKAPAGLSRETAAALETVAQIRETGLKCISFVGIPPVINHLTAFDHALAPDLRRFFNPTDAPAGPPDVSGAAEVTYPRHRHSLRHAGPAQTGPAGRALWHSIYAPLDAKLVGKLTAAHPDLGQYILQGHYGELLAVPPARAPTTLETEPDRLIQAAYRSISRIPTSVAAVACLRTIPGAAPQLVSHVHGLRKGVAAEAAEAAGREPLPPTSLPSSRGGGLPWLTTDDGITWLLRTIDRLGAAFGVQPVEQPVEAEAEAGQGGEDGLDKQHVKAKL